MVDLTDLINQLRSPEDRRVVQAVEMLRARGWLEDGSLQGVPLCHAHLQGTDLMRADLTNVDLHQANLEGADLSGTNLSGVKLARANLSQADMSQANLQGADLYRANLQYARHLTDAQLSQANRLWGAIMPDGETYDGRYNLAGDAEFARWGRVDINDPQAMAAFLGVPVETYLRGQQLVAEAAHGLG